jgi:hypothetical protein
VPVSLRLADFLDEEVLALVADLAGNEGWVSSREFADAVQLSAQNVGSRFSWLRKYGVLERNLRVGDPHFREWRLTEMGEAVMKAHFGRGQQSAFAALSEEQLPLAMRELASRFEHSDNLVAMNLMRRRFQAGVIRRRYRLL